MSYIDKIISAVPKAVGVSLPSMTVPHQAYTPREILAQFVKNDLQVMRLQASDNIDADTDSDRIVEFEDEWQARQYLRNEWKPKDKERPLATEEPPTEEPPTEEPPTEEPPTAAR